MVSHLSHTVTTKSIQVSQYHHFYSIERQYHSERCLIKEMIQMGCKDAEVMQALTIAEWNQQKG